MIQTVLAKSTGARIRVSIEGCSDALAQLIAERAKQARQSGYKTVGIYGGPLGSRAASSSDTTERSTVPVRSVGA